MSLQQNDRFLEGSGRFVRQYVTRIGLWCGVKIDRLISFTRPIDLSSVMIFTRHDGF